MKIENIIKNLTKDGEKVYRGEFDHKEFWFCNGTALVDLVDFTSVDTTATYKDVVTQIKNNKSHVHSITGKKKELNQYNKLGC